MTRSAKPHPVAARPPNRSRRLLLQALSAG